MLDAALLFTFLPTVVAPPPPVRAGFEVPAVRMLTWNPGEVSCDGGVVDGAAMQRPLGEMAAFDPQRGGTVRYRFAIDAGGRPHSIAREGGDIMPFGQDIGPALAASRFPVGPDRENCSIGYTLRTDTLASAPIADLAAYSIFGTGAKLPKEGWDRFAALGNCRDKPRPAPLLRASPDFRKLKATPGARDWSLVAYDTDADGRPIDVRIAFGTGNDELDAAAIDAIRASHYTGGARRGCLYPFWRAAEKIAAPARPDEARLRPANAACPARIEWATPPTTRYPPAYQKRGIEGWAVMSFDTAPWGEIGNVKVLEAQPSADFGNQAIFIVRSGRVEPSAQGASGCVETVKFMMPPRDQEAEGEAPAAD